MKQIYSKLLSGDELAISFPNKKELAAFKAQLYTMHSREIAAFTKFGMDCDFAEHKFSFKKINGSSIYKITLAKDVPPQESKREFRILTDEEITALEKDNHNA